MSLCSCGSQTIPTGRRYRFAGDVVEYRHCEADCKSTTTHLVAACGHWRHRRDETADGVTTFDCLDCGHHWIEV